MSKSESDVNFLLLQAIASNDIDDMMNLIKKGADVNGLTTTTLTYPVILSMTRRSMLMAACLCDNIEPVRILLMCGATPDKADYLTGKTPLIVLLTSEKKYNEEIISLLIDFSKFKDKIDEMKIFYNVCKKGYSTLVKKMVKDININVTNMSALKIATEFNEFEMIKIIKIIYNATKNITLTVDLRLEIYKIAINNNDIDFAKVLIRSDIIPVHQLSITIRHKLYDLAKYIIKNGPNINEEYNYTYSMLSDPNIIIGGQTDFLQFLLDEGLDINNKNNSPKETCLITLAKREHVKGVSLLLKLGANINEVDNKNRTALVYAVTSCNLELVKILLAGKADPTIGKMEGLSALQLAVRKNYSSVVKLLIDHMNISDIEKVDVSNCQHNLLSIIQAKKIQYLEQKIKNLEKEVDDLSLQIKYAPGGPGYMEALAEFNKVATSR